MLRSVNPYNNEVIREYEELSRERMEEMLEVSENAFRNWKEVSFADRSERMLACAEELTGNIEQYASMMMLEMGKPISEAKAEIKKCAWVCRYYAENARDFLKPSRLQVTEANAYVRYDPIGTVLAIMPWNFPFWQVFRFAAPGLMAGNTGILKHASNVSGCSLMIEEAFLKAGFPKGVFQSALIGSGAVPDLIRDDRIKAVTLTGSEYAGSQVASVAGKNIKKTVLELGGSDPFIILADADPDQVVKNAVRSRMVNGGQSCIAAKRFIVESSIAGEFTDAFAVAMRKLRIGDPSDPGTEIGPMAREDLAGELLEQVKKSVRMGSRVVMGGDRPDRAGAFFNPTILADVRPGMPAYEEELFGPVAAIITVKDEDEAISVANDSRFGLGSSLWTGNVKKAEQLASKIESGAVFINAMVASHPAVPFGGIKKSGYGRELSRAGILEFVNQKSVWVG